SDRTVAVLPFRNLGRPDDDYLADEVTDDLIDGLSMTPRLKVRSRGAMEKYRGKTVDPREVGEELGVQVVVDGSVRKVGGGVRITARLVSVADGFQLWAKRFDRPEQEVLAVNDEVAKAVAAALTLDGARPTRDAPSDPVTIDLYLRARHAYRRFWPQAMEEAVRLFDQVLERAPEDPMVLAGAALANARHAFFTGERRDVAVALGEKAVALGPTLGDAHLALANALFQVGDVERSVRELRQAIAKNPGLAEAHASLGRILLEIGVEEEGRRRVEAAIQLDEQVPLAHAALARMHALRGDWDEVERLYRAAAGHDASQGAWTALTRSAMWRRTLEETNRVLRGLDVELRDGTIPAVVLSIVRDRRFPPNWAEIIGERAGTQSAARSRVFFNQLEAEAHAYLGDDARALDPIERALDAGLIDFAWLERCPLFGDRLRAEPRFVAARERLRERVARIVAAYRAP
ncbi:MAG TPA: tetratricopeptide repeat protein, partial [Minicystis sp.]|nr:tetratricopeptide repeat protein [Minicystis sp.]